MATINILDAEPNNNRYQILNNLDYGINVFLVGVAFFFGLMSIFFPFVIAYLALLNLLLGIYQLISAFVGSLRGNKQKRTYLCLALLYLAFLIFLRIVGEGYDVEANMIRIIIVVFVYLIVPVFGAAYYTSLCHQVKLNKS